MRLAARELECSAVTRIIRGFRRRCMAYTIVTGYSDTVTDCAAVERDEDGVCRGGRGSGRENEGRRELHYCFSLFFKNIFSDRQKNSSLLSR